MTPNEGTIDRIVRFVAGVVLLGLTFAVEGAVAWILAIIGLVLLVTAVVGFCPAYRLLGINTCATGPGGGTKTA